MFTTLDERSRALDKQLIRMQEAMCKMASIAPEDLQPVGKPNQTDVWVCGRICCEVSEGRINKTSIILEGSRQDSYGRRIQLDVKEISTFSLFAGQIVLVEGINSSGRKMIAKRIIEGTPAPIAMTNPKQLLEFHHSEMYQNSLPLNVITAAGPFTTIDNLNYEPFVDLLKRMLRTKPDVLVLIGPFVDITQSNLSSGDVMLQDMDMENENVIGTHAASYEMVFIEKILRDGLTMLFNTDKSIPTNVILIPSLLDAHHECVYPQPPFGDRDEVKSKFFDESLGILDIPFSKENDPRKRVHLLPNPCMFR